MTRLPIAKICFFLALFSFSPKLFASVLVIRAEQNFGSLIGSSHVVDLSGLADVDQLVEKADSLRRMGDSKGSIALFERAKGLYEVANNIASHDYGYVLYSLGLLYFDNEEYKRAENLLAQELSLSMELDGSKHSNVAISLVSLGEVYYAQGKYDDAGECYISAIEIREKVFGKDSEEVGKVLFLLALLMTDIGDFKQAADLYKREISILENHYGSSSVDLAPSLNNLAYVLSSDGYLEEAKHFYKLSLQIKLTDPDAEKVDIAISLNNLAGIHEQLGEHEEAEEMHFKALSIREEYFGNNHPDTADSLHNLGGLYLDRGEYKKAESMLLRALEIRQDNLGAAHPETGTTIGLLGSLYQDLGQINLAKKYILQAYEISKRFYGDNHFEVAGPLNNLGNLYDKIGLYAKAEGYYLRSLEIFQRHFRGDHPNIGHLLNNLASIASERGLHEKAKALYQQSYQITENTYGNAHFKTAVAMNNLALNYRELGLFEKAKPLLYEALRIYLKEFGRNHPYTITAKGDLAGVLEGQGDYIKARDLYLEAFSLSKQVLGDSHELTAIALNNLGLIYHRLGDYDLARKYQSMGVKAVKDSYGHRHPVAIGNQKNLVWTLDDLGLTEKLVPLYREVLEADFLFIQQEAPFMSLSERQNLIDEIDLGFYERVFSYVGESDQSLELALFARLNRHGLLEELEKRQAQAANMSENQKDIVDSLKYLIGQLSSLSISGDDRIRLQQKRDALEVKLYRSLPEIQPKIVQIEQIVDSLPDNAILIEFQKYHPYVRRSDPSPHLWLEPRYLAMLLKPDGTSKSIDLGEAKHIDELISNAVSSIESLSVESQSYLAQLYTSVVKPIYSSIVEFDVWFLSPDAEMNRIPFAALRDRMDHKYLSEVVDLRILTTGRELLAGSSARSTDVGSPLVVADPEFGMIAETLPQTRRPSEDDSVATLRSPDLSKNFYWNRLEATAKEGEFVNGLIGGHLLTRDRATPNAVKSYGPASVLHLATHAFYLPDSSQLNTDRFATNVDKSSESDFVQSNVSGSLGPLLRSGIALAGANHPDTRIDDDGYLTALEVAQLDWQGNDLVVISACESGKGDVKVGEGVYGLKRAIAVSGARSSLLSLWKVDDAATAAFMKTFYKYLASGLGKSESLLKAQADFRSHPVPLWREPYVWAAFQLSGDTGPILGF